MKKNKLIHTLIIILTFALVFVGVFTLDPLVTFILEITNNRPIAFSLTLIFFLIIFYAAMCLQVIIHESGHLVCGLISGYEFVSFRIFSLCFLKTDGKIKIKKNSIPGTMGQCLMSPPINEKNAKIPYKLYNFGGTIFNGVSAIIFSILAFLLKSSPVCLPIFSFLSIFGIMLAMNNGIPMRSGLLQNDGQNVIDIGKSQEALQSFFLQLNVAKAQTQGSTLEKMPDEWFIMPEDEFIDNPLVAAKVYFICEREIEKGNFYNAHVLIRRLFEKAPSLLPLYKSILNLELIYLDALHGWASEANLLKRLKAEEKTLKALQLNPSVYRVQYATALLVNKDEKKANEYLALFEKCAKKYPYPQEIETERKLIALAKEKFSSLVE